MPPAANPLLRVAHVVVDTRSEGPGRRTAVWVQGCRIRCPQCCNPELFSSRGGELVDAASIVVRAQGTEGLTVVGGEPFDQSDGLAALVEAAGELSVVVFSGYTLEELRGRGDPATDRVLASVDVLVDGRYDRDRPDPERRWVGSTNQRIHFLTDRYGPADFEGPRTVELRFDGEELTVVGWPAWR